jgi:hypothetical protein
VLVCVVAAICATPRKCTEIDIGHADELAARDITMIMRWQCNN